MKKLFYFTIVNLLFNLSLSKAQTVTVSNGGLGQPSVYTFNYTTSGAIGTGTAVSNVFYFSLPTGYPQISPVVGGANNLQPYVTFKMNGVAYPCTTAFGVGGSWAYGVQLSVGSAATGVSIPAGAQIQIVISGLLINPSTPGAYTISWKTAKGSGETVQEFNVPLTFSGTLGTAEIKTNSKDLSLYPNPATDFIQVSGFNKAQKYTIYNVVGNKTHEGLASEDGKIDIHNLVSGMYFFKLENGNTTKFIKK